MLKSITFICHATGAGELSFKWEHDGSVIAISNSSSQQDSFIIDTIMPQHQGQYKCIVTSSYSSMTAYALATLNINGM